MAITYPLSEPTSIGIANIRFSGKTAAGISESPFSFKQQVVKHPGERWEIEVSIPPCKKDLAEEWVAFLLSLKGPFGTFNMGDPNMADPRGSAKDTPGTPVINGADQTGNIISIDGCPNSATGYLLAGDYIQLGAAGTATLHKVLTDVNTNGSGQATLDIFPSVVTAPADNATVVVSNTVGLFRLSSTVSSWEINNISSYGITFGAVGVVV